MLIFMASLNFTIGGMNIIKDFLFFNACKGKKLNASFDKTNIIMHLYCALQYRTKVYQIITFSYHQTPYSPFLGARHNFFAFVWKQIDTGNGDWRQDKHQLDWRQAIVKCRFLGNNAKVLTRLQQTNRCTRHTKIKTSPF